MVMAQWKKRKSTLVQSPLLKYAGQSTHSLTNFMITFIANSVHCCTGGFRQRKTHIAMFFIRAAQIATRQTNDCKVNRRAQNRQRDKWTEADEMRRLHFSLFRLHEEKKLTTTFTASQTENKFWQYLLDGFFGTSHLRSVQWHQTRFFGVAFIQFSAVRIVRDHLPSDAMKWIASIFEQLDMRRWLRVWRRTARTRFS